MDLGTVLDATAALGPFFALEQWRPGDGWRPLAELIADPAERVEPARALLADRAGVPLGSIEPRVAGSIVFLGVAARLLSPGLGAVVLTGGAPAATVRDLWWRPVPGGPWPMAVGPVDVRAPAAPARWFVDTVVTGVVGPVLGAFAAAFRISEQVLWGNVASGLAGAAGMVARARPDRAAGTADLVDAVSARPPLAGTADYVRPDPARAERFLVRRSCCLFYRVPGAGMCGDCVLTPDDVRREQWQSALRR